MHAASVVKLMLWAVPRSNSLRELVRLAVDTCGDTDSAAAVMVAVASESEEYEEDLPQVLYDGLEDGEFGKSYLASLDNRLHDLYGEDVV
jgi:ADP-ribosylglycohydrolase